MASECDVSERQEQTLASVHDRLEWIFGPFPVPIIKSIVVESNKTYLVTIEYGPRQWQIRRIYEDFLRLHDELMKVDPCDSKNEYQFLPKFDDQTADDVKLSQEICEKLVGYLNYVMRRLPSREREVSLEFFQISGLSFRREISASLREGYLTKRSGTEIHSHSIFHRLPIVRDIHQLKQSRKWFIVKDTFITHLHTHLTPSRFPTLVDQSFEIICHPDPSHGHVDIDINNLQRKMRVRCENMKEYDDWMRVFNELTNTAVDFLNTTKNRFGSFAPIRSNQFGSWFINGKSYMESVAKALLTAKDEVFISGWWLSPELILIRPNDDDSMRLDNLLGRIADAGVRVFVMIFKEVSQLNDINSAHTERILTGKSKLGNIRVIRHPQKTLNNKIFWSHNEKMVIIDQKIAFIGGIDLCFGRWDDEHYRLVDLGNVNKDDLVHSKRVSFSAEREEVSMPSLNIDRKTLLFAGKDYMNLFEQKVQDVERFHEDSIDRKRSTRLPWHDQAVVVFGEAARDAARHFIQRWNIHKSEKSANDDSCPFLIPKTYQDKQTFVVDDWQSFLNEKPFRIDVQCVRSVDSWSAGISITEASIHQAYLEMIDAAKYFIFIETEFFVSIPNDSLVENSIANALYQRIIRAHKSNEKFRVYIVVPLLPGFNKQHAVQESMNYFMRTISKGPNSLINRLESAGVQPTDYIGIFGLRKTDVLLDRLVTEMVYVHSKLMIIDDRMAICGSANLNDRSLLGTRDSEFSLVITDLEEEDVQLNGQTVRVGRFCSSWRRQIFSMMLDIKNGDKTNIDVVDPISDEFFTFIRQVAMKNASIHEEVFRCLPTNEIRTFNQMEIYCSKPQLRHTDPEKARERLKEVQGLIVEFPLYFLHDEEMKAGLLSTEGLLPNNFWT